MKAYGKDTLDYMYNMLTCTFDIKNNVVVGKPSLNDNKLTVLAPFRNCLGFNGARWLGVDVLLPGYTKNSGRYSPTLLRPSVSFYCKEKGDLNNVLECVAVELPVNFWAMNQSWFQANHFVDVAFGYREHCRSWVRKDCSGEAYFRPTRFWDIAEAGCVADLIVEFVRKWCNV